MPWIAPAVAAGATLYSALGNRPPGAAQPTSSGASVNPAMAENAYNGTQYAIGQQQGLVNSLAGYGFNGIAAQQDVYNQQAQLAQQLQAQSMGQGPNPAQAQLAQNTAANTANQAAMMAGQRGVSSNTGLAGRQIAQQGAMNQQNAVGQAATLQAQQQLAAQSALMQQQGMMANTAGTQIGQYSNQLNNLGNLNLAQQQTLYNAQTGNASAANQAAANQNQANQNQYLNNAAIIGGIGQGIGGLAGAFAPQKKAHGGEIEDRQQSDETKVIADKGWGKIIIINDQDGRPQPLAHGGCASNVGNMLKGGGFVPGQARVAGDSSRNDIVDAKLSPGEIVIPRSIAQHPNAPQKAAQFVAALMARK